MVYLLNILVAYLLSAISLSVLPNLGLSGFVPLIPLFFVISLSYFRKGFEPILIAAFLGIYFDIYSSLPFGSYLFLFLISASIVRYMFQEGMKSLSLLPYVLICLSATLVYYAAQIGYLLSQKVPMSAHIFLSLGYGLTVNAVCVILLYAFSGWYFEKIEILDDKLKRR